MLPRRQDVPAVLARDLSPLFGEGDPIALRPSLVAAQTYGQDCAARFTVTHHRLPATDFFHSLRFFFNPPHPGPGGALLLLLQAFRNGFRDVFDRMREDAVRAPPLATDDGDKDDAVHH